MKRITKLFLAGFLGMLFLNNLNAQDEEFCPGNLIQNGQFEQGTPTPQDQDIGNATGWKPIWQNGNLADFYPANLSGTGSPPNPQSGNYASLWVDNRVRIDDFREGLNNELLSPIAKNSGYYKFTFDLACIGGFGQAELGVYGIYNPTNNFSADPIDSHNPSNIDLFGSSNTVLLGNIPIQNPCTNTKENLDLSFASDLVSFPDSGITHILLTRSDNIISGSRFVGVDNFCIQPTDPPIDPMGCCDSLENQIVNGDFDFGREGFETEYQFENDISVSSILPGSYGVINTEEANSICDNWMVDDHTTNCDGAGNFLVVNGRTGQPGSSIFWGQTIQVVDTTDTYKLCASFKHLEQCCFNVIPTIDVIINGVVVETITIDQTSGADPCSWQDYTYSFSPDNFSVTIQFALDETALGDGNDLAVDDIIISNLPKAPFYISTQDQRPQTSNIMASIFTIAPPTGPTQDDILPSPECKYEWMVAPVTDIDFSTSPATVSTGTIDVGGPFSAANTNWGLTTSFPGYGGGGTDGTFGNGFFYIAMTVYDCECYADSTDAKVVGRFGLKLPNGGDLENFVLSDDSKEAINSIRQGAYSETVPTTTLFNQADINKLNNGPSLQQNEPNPFDNSTTISYFLPDSGQSAILRITAIDGSILETIPIEQKGNGRVRINSIRYMEGVYFYSLVIDDLVVETKRMVLTR